MKKIVISKVMEYIGSKKVISGIELIELKRDFTTLRKVIDGVDVLFAQIHFYTKAALLMISLFVLIECIALVTS